MRTTWEKIVHHPGTIYGHGISNELQNRKTIKIDEPAHTKAVLDKHNDREARRITQQTRLSNARNLQRTSLQAAVIAATDPSAPMALAVLKNDIEEAAYQATLDLPIKLNDEESTQNSNEWRAYRERTSRLKKQRGQAFSMI
jgi:predicted transcriptional regulator